MGADASQRVRRNGVTLPPLLLAASLLVWGWPLPPALLGAWLLVWGRPLPRGVSSERGAMVAS